MQRIFHTPEGVRDIYGEECSRKNGSRGSSTRCFQDMDMKI